MALDDLLTGGGGWQNPGDNITWPFGAGSGQSRIVAGGDTPQELQNYGVDQAILFYALDMNFGGDEIGYFWIGNGEQIGDPKLWIGTTRYPIPNDPTSPTAVDVNQLFQVSLFNLIVEPLRQDWLQLAIDTSSIQNGQPFLSGQTGVEFMDSGGVAVAALSQAVVFTIPFGFVPPSVVPNVDNGAGLYARWDARAINITANGFTMFMFKGAAADPNAILVNVQVNWIAATAGV